jgi:hypothetical protein
MNSKSLIRWLLLVVVAGSVAIYALQRSGQPPATTDGPTTTVANTTAAAVVITYFTTDVRCESCRKIEALSRQAIDGGFPQEVAGGAVVFRVVNTDRPEHRHYVDDYEITNKTVIISHQVDGRESGWTNRQDVWLLLDEPSEFFNYVREPVRRYLGKS